jgi:Pentapeptide repeats (9 copies)
MAGPAEIDRLGGAEPAQRKPEGARLGCIHSQPPVGVLDRHGRRGAIRLIPFFVHVASRRRIRLPPPADPYRGVMGKPPVSPYPPDLSRDAGPVAELGDLVDAVASDRDWANRRAPRLSARRVEVRQCRLTGADLAEASLSDVSFTDCRLDLVGLRMARLERVSFRGCRMEECDFSAASLEDVLLEDCQLREATFNQALLTRVEIRRCDLTGLRGAEVFRSVRMPWNDVLENAPLFAAALGVEIID